MEEFKISKRKAFLIGVTSFALIVGITFAVGEIQAGYNRTVGKDISSSETDMFHSSKGYVDGMAQDLAKEKLEYTESKDATAKAAIVAYINEKFANYNANQIKDVSLRQFLIDCRNGNIQ